LLNGKILAGTILTLLAIGISFVIGIPITLVLQKANLTGDDLARLLFLLVPAILLALTYYAISLFVSVNTNRSGYALVVAVVVWIFFTFVMPLISAFVASSILGPPPALPTGINATRPAQLPPRLQQYERNYRQITGTVQLISPNAQFNTLANAIFTVQRQQSNLDIGAVIAQNWTAILVPTIYIVVFVVLSYMFFVRRQENK
jgi:ABC-2 type transport system permease protein